MQVFFLSVIPTRIIEGILLNNNKPGALYHIFDKNLDKERYIVKSTKLYTSKEELFIDLIIKNFKSSTVEDIANIYKIDSFEVRKYWNRALDLFPEKFI